VRAGQPAWGLGFLGFVGGAEVVGGTKEAMRGGLRGGGEEEEEVVVVVVMRGDGVVVEEEEEVVMGGAEVGGGAELEEALPPGEPARSLLMRLPQAADHPQLVGR
jgi:hypothetical protein